MSHFLGEAHIDPRNISLVPIFSLKKTTSGKIKRFYAKKILSSGSAKKIEQNFFRYYLKNKYMVLQFLFVMILQRLFKNLFLKRSKHEDWPKSVSSSITSKIPYERI